MVQVTFEQDVILSQANEYEVLQLLLGECKTRLGSYAGAPFSQPRNHSIMPLSIACFPVKRIGPLQHASYGKSPIALSCALHQVEYHHKYVITRASGRPPLTCYVHGFGVPPFETESRRLQTAKCMVEGCAPADLPVLLCQSLKAKRVSSLILLISSDAR